MASSSSRTSLWWPTTRMTLPAAYAYAPSWLPEPDPTTTMPSSVIAWALPTM